MPAVYVLLFCDLLRDLGYEDGPILDELGLVRDDLLAPDARVSMLDATRVAERGLALAGHEGLGFRFASALKITLHGPVGLLALSSATIHDAIDAATRFVAIRAPFLEFHWTRDDGRLELAVVPNRDLGRHHTFVMESISIGLVTMIEQLDRQALVDAEVLMAGPQPAYYPRLARSLPVPVRYGCNGCVVRASAELLDRRPYLADPQVAALAREQCEAEMRKLFAPANDTVVANVRRRLDAIDVGSPSLPEMAKALHVSPRTLRRRLAEEGASYTELVDASRRDRAVRWLVESDLSVSEIAFRIGFSDVSNFTRALRRWTGKTPKSVRAGAAR